MYELPGSDEGLFQGDIIDGCPVFGLDDSGEMIDLESAPVRWRARVLIVTQACDLAQEKVTRVLVAMVHPADELVRQGVLSSSLIRDRVRRGLVYGWYFLPASAPPMGFPESIVDLHDLHTVPRRALQLLVAGGQRVCRLVTPYREHLAQHFAVTYSRIGLPEPYQTQS
jgi:hypothetical protein